MCVKRYAVGPYSYSYSNTYEYIHFGENLTFSYKRMAHNLFPNIFYAILCSSLVQPYNGLVQCIKYPDFYR
jgi:hypothetical protein